MSIQSEINRISGAKSDIADAIEDQGVTVPSGTKLDGMANLIGQISGGSGKLNSTQAADAYDPTATYAVGDKVSYAGNVYSCISAISTPEAWDSTHWDQVDPIQDQVDDVRNTLTKLIPILPGSTNNLGYTLQVGDYFEAGGVLYKVTTDIPNTEAWAGSASALTDTAVNDLKSDLLSIQTITPNYDNSKIGGLAGSAFKNGKSVYVYLSNITALNTTLEGVITGLPKSFSAYSLITLRSKSPPYLEVGSVWIDRSGNMSIYGAQAGTSYYVCGLYITND